MSASLQDTVLHLQERLKSTFPYKGMEAYCQGIYITTKLTNGISCMNTCNHQCICNYEIRINLPYHQWGLK